MGGERGRNFDESPPSGRRHLCGAVDHAAAAQVPVERHLDDRLALPAELLGEQGPRPLIGVPVRVVDHDDGALQQFGHPTIGQPV